MSLPPVSYSSTSVGKACVEYMFVVGEVSYQVGAVSLRCGVRSLPTVRYRYSAVSLRSDIALVAVNGWLSLWCDALLFWCVAVPLWCGIAMVRYLSGSELYAYRYGTVFLWLQ